MAACERFIACRSAPANCSNATESNPRENAMEAISRRRILTAASSGGLPTAAAAASAQPAAPQPQRPGHGGTEPGPRNIARDRQNPDILAPPATDHGTLPNFSFSDAHMRLETGGWTRQVTAGERAYLQGYRLRQHAAQCRRRARAPLAQGRRMGFYALWKRADHRHRRARAKFRR